MVYIGTDVHNKRYVTLIFPIKKLYKRQHTHTLHYTTNTTTNTTTTTNNNNSNYDDNTAVSCLNSLCYILVLQEV